MTTRRIVRFFFIALILSPMPFPAGAEDFTNAVHAYLQQRVEAGMTRGCMVVGLVDEHGSRIVSFGKLDNGTGQDADGNTVFAIHSATGTFMEVLLEEMVERGEMKLDAPVAKYLPKTVKVPIYQGQEITLRQLVKETSGLPWFYDKLNPARKDEPLADFSDEKMDAFVSGCQLNRVPGINHLHGNVDKGLLGQAMGLRAGTTYEMLMVDRILRPLQMDSTRFILTPELKSRLASEHSEFGYARPDLDCGAVAPGFGLFTTANDLLKFVSAFGLTPSGLTPIMNRSVTSLSYAPDIEGMIHTGGGGFGGSVYVAYDKMRRRGVVIFSTANPVGAELGSLLLESEWRSDRRPTMANLVSHDYASYAGQYRRLPDFALGLFVIRQYSPVAARAAIYISVVLCFVGLAMILRRAGSFRRRWSIVGAAVLVCGLLTTLVATRASRVFCARFQPGISIRREGNQLVAQATGLNLCLMEEWKLAQAWKTPANPIDVLFPRIPAELFPESETQFFERLSGVPIDFSLDALGRVTGFTMHYRNKAFSYEKISDEPPQTPEPPKRPVAIKLGTNLLDACAGIYVFDTNAMFPEGLKMTIWREGDYLMQQTWGQPLIPQVLPMYPESETNFFEKVYATRMSFTKNHQGDVTSVIYHYGFADGEGKKLKE
jgi:CubicO group peptidase (beta-lactamase class C family)